MRQNSHRTKLIESIHESDLRLSLVLTGGGSGIISELLAYPGASATVLEANIPYSEQSLARYLGETPDSFCSPDTAKLMAVQAYFNSIDLHGPEITAIGGTGALATSRPKRGEHRFYKSIQNIDSTTIIELTLEKNVRSRAAEEDLLVELGLGELGRLVGHPYSPVGLTDKDVIRRREVRASEAWKSVFLGQSTFCRADSDESTPPTGIGILSGSFNPLHEGHLEMAACFATKWGTEVHFELALRNADKPPIDYIAIDNRVRQFSSDRVVWLSQAATFVEKSRIFPNNYFIVGIDTLIRIGNAKYYRDSNGLSAAMREIKENGCRFAVYGRFDGNKFISLSDVSVDSALMEICDEIPEAEFRQDVSSTQLRTLSKGDNVEL